MTVKILSCATLLHPRPTYSPRPCSRRGSVEMVCVKHGAAWKRGDLRTVCAQHAKTWEANGHWRPMC